MPQDLQEIAVRRDEARAILLVRAVEEEDRHGVVLSHESRREATAEARPADDDAWVARRAMALVPELESKWPFLRRLLRFVDVGSGLLVPAMVLALILGMLTNALGPESQVHVLALPLAGILLWNLLVLVFLAFRRLLLTDRFARRGARPYLLDALEGWGHRLADRLPRQAQSRQTQNEGDLLRKSLGGFLKEWFASLAPLSASRLRLLLHSASLALLVGIVAGMYLRGIVFRYEAVWESTFLTVGSVEKVLKVVFAPASWIVGIEIPSARGLESTAMGDGGGDAEPWIHLWAVTALIVAVPRILLAIGELFRITRLSRRLPVSLPKSYLRRLLAAVSSDAHRVDVIPYSYRLVAMLSDVLRARLLDVFGVRSNVVIHSPVEYGAMPDEVEVPAGRCWLVLFNLSQTPEVEVHGKFMVALNERLPEGQKMVAVIEASAFKQRWPAGERGKNRWRERTRAWDRVLTDAGARAVHLDLRGDDADTVVSLLTGATEETDA